MSNLFRRLSNRKRKEDPPARSSSSSEKSSNLSPASAYGRPTSSFAPGELLPTYSMATAQGPVSEGEQPIPEDPYIFLKEFDTVFLIDDSGSMRNPAGRDHWGPSRWEQVSQALAELAPICTKYDKDGIDIHFLNYADQKRFTGVTSSAGVIRIFKDVIPKSFTPTGRRLENILDPYLSQCREAEQRKEEAPKPLNLIVITDGKPESRVNVKKVLGRIGKGLDDIGAEPHQLGVQFFQVGDDKEASEWLTALDDDLKAFHDGLKLKARKGDPEDFEDKKEDSQDKLEVFDNRLKDEPKCRDFIDTLRFIPGTTGQLGKDNILKIVLGAVNKKLDRKPITMRSVRGT